MELTYPLVVPVGLAVVALLAALVWWLMRRRNPATPVALANTALLRSLPEYARALRRQRLVVWGTAVLAGVTAVAAVIGAARPTERSAVVADKDNRDIVLCLDVSGSMVDVDTEVVATFRILAEGFRGERIGMVIFNSSAVPVFPLTDDYDFVADQLTQAQRALTRLDPQDPFFAGTLNGQGSSLIGDGLATCLGSFDHQGMQRARSVILATDNEALGRSIYTLQEAGQLATKDTIQVYGLNPSDNPASTAATELKAVVESTGGLYFPLDDSGSVSRILDAVTSREATRIPSTPRVVTHDAPEVPIAVASTALFGLLLLRRVRWRP